MVSLASTVILDSESHGTHGNISLSVGSGSHQTLLRVRVRVTLRLAVYRQSVLAPRHSRSRPEIFLTETLRVHNSYVTSSLTRGCVCLLWMCFAFVKCTYRTFNILLKIFLLRSIQVLLCQPRLWKADHVYLTYLMVQLGVLLNNI
jgi:hypothetical protein